MAPDFEVFSSAVRLAIKEVVCLENNDPTFEVYDKRGPAFDFYIDGGLDSLDVLDVAFYVDKMLNIKTGLGTLMNSGEPMTLMNLYGSIRETEDLDRSCIGGR